jgi:hypothetical protein
MRNAILRIGFVRRALVAALAGLAYLPTLSVAAVVTYSGRHFSPFGTTGNDFVVAGTFLPGFDVNNYGFHFDPNGNILGIPHYSMAVSQGIFRPIGPGTLTDGAGIFSGSGTASGINDLPIYLFHFDTADPDDSLALALETSTDPSWRVQNDGSTHIDAATATTFVYGGISNGVIQLQVAPFPEPATGTLFTIALLALGMRRRS